MNDLILIGQAPGRKTDGKGALSGRMGRILADLFGITAREYHEIRRVNLLDRFPGKSGKGDVFPEREARTRASEMRKVLWNARVIFIGVGVAKAFGYEGKPCKWFRHEGFTAAYIPHPSGINRWWNDSENKALAKNFARSLNL